VTLVPPLSVFRGLGNWQFKVRTMLQTRALQLRLLALGACWASVVLTSFVLANISGRWVVLHKQWNAWWEHGWPMTFACRHGWSSVENGVRNLRWLEHGDIGGEIHVASAVVNATVGLTASISAGVVSVIVWRSLSARPRVTIRMLLLVMLAISVLLILSNADAAVCRQLLLVPAYLGLVCIPVAAWSAISGCWKGSAGTRAAGGSVNS
jgi:hypothetical protein